MATRPAHAGGGRRGHRGRRPDGLRRCVALNDACPLDGVGTIDTLGGFRDPAGLAQLLVEEEIVQACVVEQLYTYAMGHAPDDADEPFVEALTTAFTDSGHRFDALVIEVIGSEAFAYRTEEVE